MVLPKTITIIIAVIFAALVLAGLFKQINQALEAGKRLDQAADDVAKLQDKNSQLHAKLDQTKSISFVEETARNDLNMAKSGETIVIIPQEQIRAVLAAQTHIEPPPVPNWQGWLKLFVH
jgi:cell division protein FtsB